MNDDPHPRRASSGALPSDVNMDSKQVFEALGEPDAWKGEPHRWSDAMAAYPAEKPPFLDTSSFEAKCRESSLPAQRVPLLAALAAEIEQDPALLAFAWYLHWRVWIALDSPGEWNMPTLKPRLGDRAGLFYLLLALEVPGRLAAHYRTLGYPPEIVTETASKVAWNEAEYIAGTGRPGLYDSQLRWFNTAVTDHLVQLGRLVFDLHFCWSEEVVIFRRDSDGAVIALAGNEMRVTGDGLFLDWEAPSGPDWTTTLEESPSAFTGYPAHPAGRIIRQKVRLRRPEWRKALHMTGVGTTDDATLYMHIPFGGGLSWGKVRDSLIRASAFFREYHPDKPIKLVQMCTWFLDPRVPAILGPDSNPAKFQRACYLVPEPPEPHLMGKMVFQREIPGTPPDELPARTSVQRAIIDFLKRGGSWHGGRMFILGEDMADPREGRYLEGFAALSREFGLEGDR